MAEYMPSTDSARRAYVFHTAGLMPPPQKRAGRRESEFDRWLETVRAEAKAEALREAASDVFDTEMPAHTARWLEDRANQYKGTTDA